MHKLLYTNLLIDMLKKDKNYNNEVIAATCLLLSIAVSDEKLEIDEVSIIKEIICDFFWCRTS